MFTTDELMQIRGFRALVEQGREDLVSREQRQWILDLYIREGIPLQKEIYDAATSGGFNVDGLKVKEND